jgi:hypothetical protein
MSISNCCSSGADSRADPITGIVTRRDATTGQTIPASVRPAGMAQPQADADRQQVSGTSLSSAILLSLQSA